MENMFLFSFLLKSTSCPNICDMNSTDGCIFFSTFVLTTEKTTNCHCTVKSFVDGAVLKMCVCVRDGVEPLDACFPHGEQPQMGFKGPVWEISASTQAACQSKKNN